MAEIIQFDCPICGTLLRLPLALAASRGPCPRCSSEIIAPDPHTGIGAHSAPIPTPVTPTPAIVALETAAEPTPPPAPATESSPVVAIEPSPPVLPEPTAPDSWPTPIFTPEDPTPEIQTQSVLPIPAAEPSFIPFAASSPAPVHDSPKKAAPEKICNTPRAAVIILSCLLTGIVMLVLGTFLGFGLSRLFKSSSAPQVPLTGSGPSNEQEITRTPALPSIPSTPPDTVQIAPSLPEETLQPNQPVPSLESSPPADVQPDAPARAPEKVSAAAEATLRAFLEAPNWASRSVHVLFPARVREAMESYSRVAPDGATPFSSVTVQQSQVDPSTGLTTFIFLVATDSHPGGIPVAVKETSSGWLVDWETFVEFRDALFSKFAEGPAERTGRFHLILSPPPPKRAADTENEYFSSFLISSPLGEEPRLAFVKKETDAHNKILTATQNGGIFTPVLEVTKRKTSTGQFYLEIVSVTATNWLPHDEK